MHRDRNRNIGRFPRARVVRNQQAAADRRHARLRGHRLHADPPPSWLERAARAMGRLPAARVRAAAVDHRVRRNRPRTRGIITSGLTWWQIALRWLTDPWLP